MNKHITEFTDMIMSCSICQKYQKSAQSEPIIPHEIVELPFNKIACDIFHLYNESYLLVTDYYSKYVEVANLNKNLTNTNVTNKLKSIFARFGIPRQLISNNGPEFNNLLFKNFAKEWEFEHKTISPKHSQSNGQVERQIQTVKNIFKK